MKFKNLLCIGLLSSTLFAQSQLMYTPEMTLNTGKSINLVHVQMHPYTNLKTYDMGTQHKGDQRLEPEEFYVMHKTIKTDLKDTLKPIVFTGKNEAKSYTSKYKAKKMGDHLFVMKPAPSFSEVEGIYLQMITKMFVNVAGKPTDWDKELGLEAEIIPLSKPYGIWAGSSFSGMVKASGIPVPFAHIEVELLNYDIDMENNKTTNMKTNAPQQSFKVIEFKANERGEFTFHIPKEGLWSFNAKGIGHNKKFKGRELSQDAVIWVQSKNIKEIEKLNKEKKETK